MPIEPAAPRFPLTESLRRFFRLDPRARVPLSQVAELLGMTADAVGAMLRNEGGHRRTDSLPWTEAAAYLFDAWPRARILDSLGPGFAEVIPVEFQLTRVSWALPIFLVRAMEHQAARAWQDDPRVRASLTPNPLHARGIDDYIGDVLYGEIQPETVAAFREDSAFVRAFHYPVID